MQADLPKDRSVPRLLRQIGSRLIRLLHCAFEGVCLFRLRVQLHLRDQFHVKMIVRMFSLSRIQRRGAYISSLKLSSLLRQ